MKKFIACVITGLLLFMLGIYLSSLETTTWVAIGTALSVLGGLLMGGSTYFLIKAKKTVT